MPSTLHTGDVKRLVDRLCDTRADTVFFPVRHHSPASAVLVGSLIDSLQPAAVLIEGPSDFNQHLDELLLDHQLPIAIYSYLRSKDKGVPGAIETHQGAYYPFCDYSPEWVALKKGHKLEATVRFIDLPWAAVADADRTTHRYADAELRSSRYVRALCARLQVEDFDDLWDRIVESHGDLSLEDYLQRAHSLCLNIRMWEHEIRASDRQRESFMVQQINEARKKAEQGKVLVVTGGFHSSALAARLENLACPGIDEPQSANSTNKRITDQGIALTTYSYQRLDNLTGYNAGMPSPGFYDHAWHQRRKGLPFEHQPLLVKLVDALRQRKQILSTADLIAVETSALALAAMRGRNHVWRRDLIDAVSSSLIKDELEYACDSPFINAVHDVLRGDRQGALDQRTRMPPLVSEIRRKLKQLELQPQRRGASINLDLLESNDLQKSRLLHQLHVLEIRGFTRDGGTDFLVRDDMERLWESWRLRWTPEFEASCIEASRYGTTLRDAVTARLLERTGEKQRDAEAVAELLVTSAQTGVETLAPALLDSLTAMIAAEPQFSKATSALGHLLYLYCFDEVFGTARLAQLTQVAREAFARSLWLLELLGQTVPNDGSVVRSLRTILETYQRAAVELEIDPEEFTRVLQRVQSDENKPPQVRGGVAGMLWTLGNADSDSVLKDLMFFSNPDHLGDFLTGVFSLAREVAQRHPQLVNTIDKLLLNFGAVDFQAALPSLRLAFTAFTPREKHHMLSTLFESLGQNQSQSPILLPVDERTAAEALGIEERLWEAIEKYGLEAP